MLNLSRRDSRRYIWIALAAAAAVSGRIAPLLEGLTRQGQASLGVFVMAAILWVSGAVPLAVTGMLILAALPLAGALPATEAFSLFGSPAVFFILGAFILASALMSTGLSNRIALFFLLRFGGSARKLATGILVGSALMSCVMPEHAVAAIVFPTVATIAAALELQPRRSKLAILLFLSMAWGCVTGGVATMLGGARTPLALGILEESTGKSFSFADWSAAAAPVALAVSLVTLVVLHRFFPPEIDDVSPARRILEDQVKAAGPMSTRERRTAVIAVLTILSWVALGETVGLAVLALVSACALFAVRALTWQDAEETVNWSVLLMYGGAIALGSALARTQATEWLAGGIIDLFSASPVLFVAITALLALALTEVMSNAACVAVLLPVALSASQPLGLDPRLVVLAVAVPSGLAFTLPVGTPPNAIAYSSGYYGIRDVVVPGVLLSVISFLIFLAASQLYWPYLSLR